ncbi:MAG: metal-binding protein [Burkholderiales bacterium]|nr:metal-binding protein [Burkholderiales bacterium]
MEHNTRQVAAARQKLAMPQRYGACHTARVDGYVIEGHVPAADIKRLLEERPIARGLAVPGMPIGSPGMEGPNPQPYQTLLIGTGGNARVFAEH